MERCLDEHERENNSSHCGIIINIVGIGDRTVHFDDIDSKLRNNRRININNNKQQHRLENKFKHML